MRIPKVVFLIIIGVALSGGILFGCSGQAKSNVTITLEASAGTGYEWVDDSKDQDVLELTNVETKSESELAGGVVETIYTFKAKQAGTTRITFSLERSWEETDEDTHVTYEFNVDDNLNVEFLGSVGSYSGITTEGITAPHIS